MILRIGLPEVQHYFNKDFSTEEKEKLLESVSLVKKPRRVD